MEEQLVQLRGLAARHLRADRPATAVPRLSLYSRATTSPVVSGMFQPTLCLVLQGAKSVTVGDRTLRYDPAHYFIASVEVPASGCIIEATADKPYVGLTLQLDWDAVAALVPEVPAPAGAKADWFGIGRVTPELLDAWLRLARLLDTPADIPVLAPLHEREILYRLLQGPQGGVLRQLAWGDSRLSQVRRVIAWIRDHFDRPLSVDALAAEAGMSTASLHRHFKAATALSPLQYQKRIRLQEARRLLVGSHDASGAAYAVGYESASQFSREYARLFGCPPARDALRLRGLEIEAAE